MHSHAERGNERARRDFHGNLRELGVVIVIVIVIVVVIEQSDNDYDNDNDNEGSPDGISVTTSVPIAPRLPARVAVRAGFL